MSEGMYADQDIFTDADREALRALHHTEQPRTEETVREVEGGTLVQSYERREIFSFEAPGEGAWRFDVRQIKDAIVEGRLPCMMFRIPEVPESFYRHVLERNGVEVPRLARVSESAQERPGIMVVWGNAEGHSTLIDGNHRLVRRWQLGKKDFRFVAVTVEDCKPFMCRPGDEEKLFAGKRDPNAELLHAEIIVENLDG